MPIIVARIPTLAESDDSPEGLWRRLRMLRASPPGAASQPERRQVFTSALEQSEQLFLSATRIGNATRPLLIFYSLSQASRAIAAAALTLDSGSWRLRGHGLGAPDLVQRPLGEVVLRPSTRPSAFRTMQKVLGSPEWTQPVTLADVWSANPSLATHPLPRASGEISAPAVRVGFTHQNRYVGTDIPDLMIGLEHVPAELLDDETEESVVALLKRHYPSFGASVGPDPRHYSGGHAIPTATMSPNGSYHIHRSMTLPANIDLDTWMDSITVEMEGRWAVPPLGGDGGGTEPLVLWWALLFGLSMRARYEPEGWTEDLDVDHSPIAVTLEQVLDLALEMLPTLVLDAIRKVSGGGS